MKARGRGLLALAGALALAAPFAAAPAPPRNIMAEMNAMKQALGVECSYCHSAARGSGAPEPKKDIARAMMAMTRGINAQIRQATGQPADAPDSVTCATCHHGMAVPKPLQEILSKTVAEKGGEAAVAQYRELRQKYYGRGVYDFGEDTLIGVARPIAYTHTEDAVALLKLNLEFNPNSVRTYETLAYVYTRALDDDDAMAALETALEIDPHNGVVQGQLEQLKSYHRKR
jgi:tetratricopeptide (TPR) repeat protein